MNKVKFLKKDYVVFLHSYGNFNHSIRTISSTYLEEKSLNIVPSYDDH